MIEMHMKSIFTYQNRGSATGDVGAWLVLRKRQLEMRCKVALPVLQLVGERRNGAEGDVM